MRRLATVAAVAALIMGLAVVNAPSSHAAGNTLWVNANGALANPPGTSCSRPGYRHIQDAVNVAAPGDVINVCPGTYVEQVDVATATKSDITLRSTQLWAAVIKAPTPMLAPAAIVHVDNAQNDKILGFTITGPGGGQCNSIDVGVLVNDRGSAEITGNHITQIRDNPFGGCQNGQAVQIGSFTLSGGVSTPGQGIVRFNLIDQYQKTGVIVNEAGSYGRVEYNRISGAGPTPTIAQNGIQVGFFAAADVTGNVVTGNSYTGTAGAESMGILLTDDPNSPGGAVTVLSNDVSANDNGIYLGGDPGLVDPSTELGPTSGQKVLQNRAHQNRFDGIFADEFSLNNDIIGNRAFQNGRYDCHDESPPGNLPATTNNWRNNEGRTMNKPNLCRPGSDNTNDGGGQPGDGGRQAPGRD